MAGWARHDAERKGTAYLGAEFETRRAKRGDWAGGIVREENSVGLCGGEVEQKCRQADAPVTRRQPSQWGASQAGEARARVSVIYGRQLHPTSPATFTHLKGPAA
jgi:hypothetical protein